LAKLVGNLLRPTAIGYDYKVGTVAGRVFAFAFCLELSDTGTRWRTRRACVGARQLCQAPNSSLLCGRATEVSSLLAP
jgi:hypothetical protein